MNAYETVLRTLGLWLLLSNLQMIIKTNFKLKGGPATPHLKHKWTFYPMTESNKKNNTLNNSCLLLIWLHDLEIFQEDVWEPYWRIIQWKMEASHMKVILNFCSMPFRLLESGQCLLRKCQKKSFLRFINYLFAQLPSWFFLFYVKK